MSSDIETHQLIYEKMENRRRRSPVVCCKNYRVCIPYNMWRVVCAGDLVEPSQLSQIKFMTISPQNRPPKSKELTGTEIVYDPRM